MKAVRVVNIAGVDLIVKYEIRPMEIKVLEIHVKKKSSDIGLLLSHIVTKMISDKIEGDKSTWENL